LRRMKLAVNPLCEPCLPAAPLPAALERYKNGQAIERPFLKDGAGDFNRRVRPQPTVTLLLPWCYSPLDPNGGNWCFRLRLSQASGYGVEK
jgi:hypothetical protein